MNRIAFFLILCASVLSVKVQADDFPDAAITAWRKDRISVLNAQGISAHDFTATITIEENPIVTRGGKQDAPNPSRSVQFFAKLGEAFISSSTNGDVETRFVFNRGTWHSIRHKPRDLLSLVNVPSCD